MNVNIKTKFDDISKDYDSQRERLIPCFHDFYGITTLAADSACKNPKVLDIGAGTGLLSSFLSLKYPDANFTLIDISEKMLDLAKIRFENNNNMNFTVSDYTEYNFTDKYDIIMSSLSIHHLENEDKKALYKKCYNMLNPNGVFINADQVLGSTPFIENRNKKLWKQKIESSGLSRNELEACYERIKLDKEATLDKQLSWLKESGFSDVDCVYKYLHFAILFGRKVII